MDFTIKNFITKLDDVSTCTQDEEVGQVLHLVQNSHDGVFVLDNKNNLFGLINPYQELFKKRHPLTTKVQSVALISQHLTPDSSIFETCRFMWESRIYRLPIFSNQKKLAKKIVGKIDVKDILKTILLNDNLLDEVVNNLKISKVVVSDKNALVKDVYNILRQKGISRIVLVDNQGQVVGIISRSDIQKAFISPTSRQRFSKKSGDHGQFMFDEEKITRRDEPVVRYETYMVRTISNEKSKREVLSQVINSKLDDIVLIDKASKPVGILTTRDILQAIVKSKPEYLPNIIFEKPKGVLKSEINAAYHILVKFIKKINKRRLINKVRVSFKEAKFLTGKVAVFDITLIVDFYDGRNYVAKTEKKDLLMSIRDSVKELEEQLRRDVNQKDHHKTEHHNY